MTILLAALLSLSFELPSRDAPGSPLTGFLTMYRAMEDSDRESFCASGDTQSCLVLAARRILDETVPVEDAYGELSGARSGDPEFTPRILVSEEAKASRAVAVYLLVANRWRQMDPGMICDLINDIGEPYFSRLHPLYLRRLAEAGRMTEFLQDFRMTENEQILRLYVRELIKRDPEEAFVFLKGVRGKLSESLEEEIDGLFTAAWAGKKETRRDYQLWRMYVNYRAFRYDRCLRIGKQFPKSDAAKDATDWRAGLLRAMSHTRKRDHQDAIDIYRNLEDRMGAFDLLEEDMADLYRWSGYSYAALGKNPEAIAAYLTGYGRLAASDKGDSFLYHAADMERLTENWPRAEELYLRIIAEYPLSTHRSTVEFLVFWIRYLQKRYDEATAVLASILQSSLRNSYDAQRARYWQGRIDEKSDRDPEAILAFCDIAREQPLSYYGMLAASRLRVKNIGCDIPATARNAVFPMRSGHRFLPEMQWVTALWATGQPAVASSLLYLVQGTVTGAGAPEDRLLAAHLAQELSLFGLAGMFARSLPTDYQFSGDIAKMQYPVGYEQEIVPHAALYRVPILFVVALARQESNFETSAVSSSNAVGLLQLLPGTANLLAKEEGYGGTVTGDLLKKPFTNARFGVKFLGGLLKRYQGNMALAAAAYNAGPGKADRWVKRMAEMEMDELVENIPIFQTRNYVKKVLSNYAAYHYLYEGAVYDAFEFALPGKPVSRN